MWKAAECRGLQYLWTMLAAAYVAPVRDVHSIDMPLIGRTTFSDEHARSHVTAPEPPIP
jgi:hypothetical protein